MVQFTPQKQVRAEAWTTMAIEQEEIERRGLAIYQETISRLLPDSETSKTLVIDVNSEDYELDADEAAATKRLLARQPDACCWTLEILAVPKIRASWRMTFPDFRPPTSEDIEGMKEEFRREGWQLDD